MESNSNITEFINFLHDDLAISTAELAVVIRQRQQSDDPLSMLLWQYGLLSLKQLQQIFDWQERHY